MGRGWIASLAVSLAITQFARAGNLVGTVKLSAAPAQEKDRTRYPGAQTPPRLETPERAATGDVVIYLERCPAGAGPHPVPVLAQRNKSFVPRALPVKVGTSVSFPNEDGFYHNVFSYSKQKAFDLGRYPRGQSRSLTFDKVGLVKVFCEIHSQMKGYILVLESDAFTVPDASGAFRIQGIAPGSYKVVGWHPSFKPVSFQVTITGGDTRQDFDF